MLRILVKKQLMEVFRKYFYNAKNNTKRSPAGIVGMFILFGLLMIGVIGGIFGFLAASICAPFCVADMDWFYFAIMSGIALFMGLFGSVFNTFSYLYLAKDNDLLLSMPIPLKYIISSRLINVLVLSAVYSLPVILPTIIIYWIQEGITLAGVLCSVLLIVILNLIVLALSCLLGWCVAKISLKLKNKSFVTVVVSLVFIGLYYFFYFKAQEMINILIKNVVLYGEKIKGSAYMLYLFGQIATGDYMATLIYTAITVAVIAISWLVLKGTFLSIATSSGKTEKVRYKEKTIKQKAPFRALIGKEFSKFISSPVYMLNCGLGVLIIPLIGIVLLIKGRTIIEVLQGVFGNQPGLFAVFFSAVMLLTYSMNDSAAAAVSLEGKSLWIPQSLPVDSKWVLRAKTSMQFLLTIIPILFTTVCCLIVMKESVAISALTVYVCLINAVFSAVFSSFLGIQMPNLTWTNEVVPIKQSSSVFIAVFGTWGFAAVFVVGYLLLGYKIGAVSFLLIYSVLMTLVTAFLQRWLDTKGVKIFDEL